DHQTLAPIYWNDKTHQTFWQFVDKKYFYDNYVIGVPKGSVSTPTYGWNGYTGTYRFNGTAASGKGGCDCFTAGTKIQTDEGEKNIEDIEVGDKVLSKDEETGEVAYKEVTATFNHETDEIYSIQVGGQTIESTFNHPFYVKDKGWTFVKDLKVGDLLVQSDGNTLKIDSIELEQKHVTVYNMTVDEFHTYFVSGLGIWVHNTSCSGGMNNVRVMQNTKVKGYTISMDVEKGGSGQVNIHVKVNDTKYFYNSEKGEFLDANGNRLPNSLRGNEQINAALKKAQKYEQNWSGN
ncbi:polymorphic toxin-type HINT domain-containing protein, partial [Paenibacillus sp. MMS18-CY102]|uniref:polymorphic toxin-type HINT domain-containing protein n=1 Tax=Paenibacillus sp. MMS18-CY102 TaxID=2682849 RepID=UPI001F2752EF